MTKRFSKKLIAGSLGAASAVTALSVPVFADTQSTSQTVTTTSNASSTDTQTETKRLNGPVIPAGDDSPITPAEVAEFAALVWIARHMP